nr:helix-turn-helix transcriptional regulator [uncultured Dysosmobacter sp.]
MASNKIREFRKAAGLTQEQLSSYLDVKRATLARYEAGTIDPPATQLQRIAAALGVSVSDLLGQEKQEAQHGPWSFSLEQKLAAVGCSIGFYEEDAALWINYPDGTLEVTEEELKALNDSADSFLRFKLAELKESRKADFRPKK